MNYDSKLGRSDILFTSLKYSKLRRYICWDHMIPIAFFVKAQIRIYTLIKLESQFLTNS